MNHLSAELIARYIDQDVGPRERSEVEAHAAECEACGADLIGAARSVRRSRLPARPRHIAPVLGAAAAILLVGVGAIVAGWFGRQGPRFRDAAPGEPSVRVVRPAHRSVLPRDSLTFVWRSAVPGAAYSFTLTDEIGDILWRDETSDTTLSLDRDVALRPGERYFWYIDALFPDGRVAESGLHELTAGR